MSLEILDYIDMGPEGGQLGGEIIATELFEEIKQNKKVKLENT